MLVMKTLSEFVQAWDLIGHMVTLVQTGASVISHQCAKIVTLTIDVSDPEFKREWTNGAITPKNKVGSTTFNDLQLTYNTPWESKLSIGANNVFDKQGPIMYSGPSSTYSYYGGFDIGRQWYFRYSQSF